MPDRGGEPHITHHVSDGAPTLRTGPTDKERAELAEARLHLATTALHRERQLHGQDVTRAVRAEARLARIEAGIQEELADRDPSGTMRATLEDDDAPGDPGIPGNSWWRTYCEVGALLIAHRIVTEEDDSG